MPNMLKPLEQQVIVITGATSGIGLVTARMAVKRGARVMLVARDEGALKTLCDELNANDKAVAAYALADVGDEAQVQAAAAQAMTRFGGFDTWINNAGVSIYGHLEDVPTEDLRRLFETNFWGVVYGSRVAVKHLRERGGALINLGSELSDVTVPLQGMYSASKHAVKGFTDALRIELLHDKAPISVTLVKPAGTDTMFVEHARNFLDVEPKLPPPVYAPEVVARAILNAAERPQRDVYAGGASRALSVGNRLMPGVLDLLLHKLGYSMQRSARPREEGDALHASSGALRERSGKHGMVFEHSPYTMLSQCRGMNALLLVGGALGLGFALTRGRRTTRPQRLLDKLS